MCSDRRASPHSSTSSSDVTDTKAPPMDATTDEPRARRAHERTSVTAGRAIATMLLAFAVAIVFGASSLEKVAERQPYGRGRDIALDLVRPVAWLSHALFLDRPRDWLASWTGHEDPPTK